MSIKTNELPQVERLEAEDRFLADTTAGTGGIAYGDVLEQVKGDLLPVMRSEASAQMSAANQFEAGVTSITNARTYPFNGSFATVVLAAPARRWTIRCRWSWRVRTAMCRALRCTTSSSMASKSVMTGPQQR